MTKYHKLAGFKQQNLFWRLEAWNQIVSRATLPLKPVGENTSLPLDSFWCFAHSPWHSLADSCSTSIFASIVTWWSSLLCLCVCVSSLLIGTLVIVLQYYIFLTLLIISAMTLFPPPHAKKIIPLLPSFVCCSGEDWCKLNFLMHLSNFIVVPGIPEDFSLSLKSSSLRLRFEHSGTVFKVYVLGDNSLSHSYFCIYCKYIQNTYTVYTYIYISICSIQNIHSLSGSRLYF